MSTRNRILVAVGLALVAGIILRFVIPEVGQVGKPVVSVSAEPLIHTPFGFDITNSLLTTVLVTLFLTIISFLATKRLRSGDEDALRNPRGLQNFMEVIIEQLYATMESVNAQRVARFFPLVATIFLFVVVSSWSGLIPGVGSIYACVPKAPGHASVDVVTIASIDSFSTPPQRFAAGGTCPDPENQAAHPILRAPSSDLNMTLALAMISFFFTEFWGFRTLGLGYLKKFFVNPIRHGGVAMFVGLIELISEFARLISFTFRLFGNIFAGEVVLLVMAFLFPTLLSLPFYGLELFVGFIQGFVFSILTMVFMSMATESHDHDAHDAHGAAAAH